MYYYRNLTSLNRNGTSIRKKNNTKDPEDLDCQMRKDTRARAGTDREMRKALVCGLSRC